MTGIKRLRELIDAVDSRNTLWSVTTREYDKTHGITSTCSITLRDFLADIADQIEREQDATVADSPYDALPPDEREAVAWVRDHGGLERVKGPLDWVVGHCSTRQQLDFDFWLSGRVMHELGFEEDMADRDEVERRLLARLMPEGMEWLVEAWPRFEDDAPVRFLDDFERYGEENGVSAVTMYSDGSFALNFRAYSKGERVKRPAPKVLDADGVEIRKGDTVWTIKDARELEVTGLYPEQSSCPVKVKEHKNGACIFSGIDPDQLTHRTPVLAADGLPLREGETVWYRDHIDPLEVRGISTTESGAQYVKAYNDYEADGIARLFQGVDEDASADIRDLVRRAKALAERDA